MTDVELHTDKPKLVTLLAFIVALLASACYVIITPDPGLRLELGSWIGLPLLSLITISLTSQILATGPAVLITPQGIEDRRYAWKVPWSEVEGVHIDTYETLWISRKYLRIDAKKPEERYLMTPSSWSARIGQVVRQPDRLLGTAKLGIDFSTLNGELEETCDRLRALGFVDETDVDETNVDETDGAA